jgi:hypothetical protein
VKLGSRVCLVLPMKLGVESNDPTVRVIQELVPPFGGQPPDLLRQDLLGFICEQVLYCGWFRDHIRHASLEQRILDEAGNTVGRVSELPPRRRPQLEFVVSREGVYRGAVYDCNEVKVVEFIASDQLRVRRRIVFDDDYVGSGRRLEVVDGAGKHAGALVGGEYGGLGTIEGRSRQLIGATRQVRGWGWSYDAIEDSSGAEVGWVATPRAHAKRLAARGIAVSPSSLELRWSINRRVRERHFPAITANVTDNMRLMMLAIAASIHLGVLDPPHDDDGDL